MKKIDITIAFVAVRKTLVVGWPQVKKLTLRSTRTHEQTLETVIEILNHLFSRVSLVHKLYECRSLNIKDWRVVIPNDRKQASSKTSRISHIDGVRPRLWSLTIKVLTADRSLFEPAETSTPLPTLALNVFVGLESKFFRTEFEEIWSSSVFIV